MPELELTTAEVQRFKAAFNADPVDLPEFALLIGRNGSGKSTVLEALQWIDTTLRRDAREACERYRGMQDLVNLRSQTKVPYFEIELAWSVDRGDERLRYRLRVEATEDNAPAIASERLWLADPEGHVVSEFIVTDGASREIVDGGLAVRESDRLALGLVASLSGEREALVIALRDWWDRAVFLRLSPNRLTEAAPAKRRSFDPLLDEEGHTLAGLLNELTDEERTELVDAVQDILPGIRGVEVSTEGSERNQRANYALLERMPYRGRAGRFQFPIPAWMLSEGTRRLTAILALLVRRPAPSLLCVEEIENGLDPWSVQSVLSHLQEASANGTQVILTTHSPWLLDHVPIDDVLLVRREEGNTEYRHFASMSEVEAFDPSMPAGTIYVNVDQ